jgi:hypothetical protein
MLVLVLPMCQHSVQLGQHGEERGAPWQDVVIVAKTATGRIASFDSHAGGFKHTCGVGGLQMSVYGW